jgi:hypothetical protein
VGEIRVVGGNLAQLAAIGLHLLGLRFCESALSHSKQMKRGEYEQGRKN